MLIRRPAAIAFAVGLMVITAGTVGLLLARTGLRPRGRLQPG